MAKSKNKKKKGATAKQNAKQNCVPSKTAAMLLRVKLKMAVKESNGFIPAIFKSGNTRLQTS